MRFLNDKKPIIACATPSVSNSAIGKIRISGFACLNELKDFFTADISRIKPRVAKICKIGKEQVLDEAICIFYKAPNSYNGENILELDVHGNQLNIRRIIDFFLQTGAIRMAFPGEFTYRAYRNGKMTLSQIEGLDLLINAQSALVFDEGMALLSGELSEKYHQLLNLFTRLKASLELSMDFLEDIGEERAQKEWDEALADFLNLIKLLFDRTRGEINSLLTPTVVILGKTNAGKSSLFNHLLSEDRSIVSNVAGTTRDFVSESIFIENTNFKLIDTAGLRETYDQIEKLGMDKALNQINNAFFKILVVNPLDKSDSPIDTPVDLVIFTHMDVPGFSTAGYEFAGNPKVLSVCLGPIGPSSGPIGPIIKKEVIKKFKLLADKNPILIERHRQVIGNIYDKTIEFQQLIEGEQDIGILASELNILGASISELIGIVSPEQVLTRIFSNFCIGK